MWNLFHANMNDFSYRLMKIHTVIISFTILVFGII